MTKITETALRDAHQSLFATRMRTEDVVATAPLLDRVGFASLEAWGGATFDSCLRFLAEDPWERLRRVKAAAPSTPIQMLLRGQNLVGYRNYADDVVDEFVRLAAANGVDVFRVFDALNDTRNMERALAAIKRTGKHAQGAISYTTSPVHSTESFIETVRTLAELGCDSICIKDMSGIIMPRVAHDLIKALKKAVGLPVVLHSHCTAGTAPMAYQAAIDAGVDRLDCAISPIGGGTAQPHTESIAYAVRGTPEDAGVDFGALASVTEAFKAIREKYLPLIEPISERVDTRVLLYQLPGGMLSNLLSQLKAQNKLDRFEEVLDEVPRVRADCGYPPLVTPTSQIVGTQAVFNVLMGRYKVVSKETKALVQGGYGRTPQPIDPEFAKKILGGGKQIEGRAADHLAPELDALRAEHEPTGLVKRPEDLLTLAMNPQVGKAFLAGEVKAEKAPWEG
ncbi:MAG: pyruvate carboxylase subunit B [Proteobacteria bacterium]|jgi:pyruvate carboxylase subunit B|nr:pyruvate carboxylase subunit B [Pseudomonadota bacterium]